MEIVEPHMYAVDDAVAKIDGYIISIAGAAAVVGEKRMVRIDQVGRTAASALLLDELGEVVRPAPATSPPRRARRAPRRSAPKTEVAKSKRAADGQAAADRAEANDGSLEQRRDGRARARGQSSAGRSARGEVDVQPADAPPDGGAGDGLQSKPRRRSRRGGRRRSTAKAKAAPK